MRDPPAHRPLVYATRRSPLALAQCRAFVARLQAAVTGLEAAELQVVTSGDRLQDVSLAEVGGKGLFVKEIEEALLARKADFAVHSMKDLPAMLPEGLVVACVPEREQPNDVLIAPRHRTFDALPEGARVGTSSLRRGLALRSRRPDLQIVALRGNVDTRLRKVEAGEYDAIVLARAGLARLGLADKATEVLSTDHWLPAPGQGALAVECRSDDVLVRSLLARLHDVDSAMCVATERGVLAGVEGDCKTPLGALAQRGQEAAGTGGTLRLRAFLAHPDGTAFRSGEQTLPWPAAEADARAAGVELGESLLAALTFRKK